jgi:C4-dicarboxylate transporter DctQ subunit
VRKRTHLVFNDIRLRMPLWRPVRLHVLDAMLWIVFGTIVACTTHRADALVR